MHSIPPKKYLLECFHYEPSTGSLIWKTRPAKHFGNGGQNSADTWNKMFAGKEAGCIRHGYRRLCMSKRQLFAHRVIWKIMTGQEPPRCIDHINGDGCDNRWANIREATAKQNCHNRAMPVTNTSGYKGVTFKKSRYIEGNGAFVGKVSITLANGKRKTFHTKSHTTARAAYEELLPIRERVHKEFAKH